VQRQEKQAWQVVVSCETNQITDSFCRRRTLGDKNINVISQRKKMQEIQVGVREFFSMQIFNTGTSER